MSRYKKIEYVKCVGCCHDDKGNPTGGIEIPMVALFDSAHISEEQANQCLHTDEETPYIMLITKEHYDNILQPAVSEAKHTNN